MPLTLPRSLPRPLPRTALPITVSRARSCWSGHRSANPGSGSCSFQFPTPSSIARLTTCTRAAHFHSSTLPRPSSKLNLKLSLLSSQRTGGRNISTMSQEFKLKDLTSLSSLEPNQKLEVEVEGIEDGKVLLINYDGQIHALSPRCTHYGAPLKAGVLGTGGRLTCAWHGGMFPSTIPFHSNHTIMRWLEMKGIY